MTFHVDASHWLPEDRQGGTSGTWFPRRNFRGGTSGAGCWDTRCGRGLARPGQKQKRAAARWTRHGGAMGSAPAAPSAFVAAGERLCWLWKCLGFCAGAALRGLEAAVGQGAAVSRAQRWSRGAGWSCGVGGPGPARSEGDPLLGL